MKSTIRARPVGVANRLNPQSALPKAQHCFRRSELELRGRPRNWSPKPGGLHSVPLLAQIPNPPMEPGLEG
eukprot:15485320-Alexandrium_andersonii.AAC.1